jgi:hypothetical protein
MMGLIQAGSFEIMAQRYKIYLKDSAQSIIICIFAP